MPLQEEDFAKRGTSAGRQWEISGQISVCFWSTTSKSKSRGWCLRLLLLRPVAEVSTFMGIMDAVWSITASRWHWLLIPVGIYEIPAGNLFETSIWTWTWTWTQTWTCQCRGSNWPFLGCRSFYVHFDILSDRENCTHFNTSFLARSGSVCGDGMPAGLENAPADRDADWDG